MNTRMNGMASEAAHQFIVIEGPIGVGKTSLARRLCASLAAQGVLEEGAQNPFLERFYRNPRAAALPTQLYFLLQRAQQLASLQQQDLFGSVRVADYLLEKDRLFAKVTLDQAEYRLYEQVCARPNRISSSICRPPSMCCSSGSPGAALPTSSISSGRTSSA